jgi:hypothetical protein
VISENVMLLANASSSTDGQCSISLEPLGNLPTNLNMDTKIFPCYVLFVFVLCLMPNVACVSGLVFFLVVFVTKHLDFRQLRKVKVGSIKISDIGH